MSYLSNELHYFNNPVKVNGNIATASLGQALEFADRDDLLIRGTASYDMEITAPQDVAFGIDSDNNETTHAFLWKKDTKTPSSAGTELMRLTEAGNLGIGTSGPNEKLEVYPNTDVSAIIGNAVVGYNFSDYASFSHYDMRADTNGYALLQKDDGTTYLNAPTGMKIYLREENSTKFMLDGNHFRADQTNGASMRNEVPSATNPVFTFNNDVDTGMGRAAADVLSLIAGGAEQLRLDNGNATAKFYNNISFEANKGITNQVGQVTEYLPNAAGGAYLDANITGEAKIQSIVTDSPPINWMGQTTARINLPAAAVGREYIINWADSTFNPSGYTFSLNPVGSDALYKAGVNGPVGFNKVTGESIHVICAESGIWSVVAHT